MIQRFFRWLGRGGLTALLLGRQGLFSLRESWGIAALSVVLAASLWVYVTDQDDAERTASVGAISVQCVNVPPAKAILSPCSDQTVVVRVRAPDSVLNDLTSLDFTATADLSAVTADTATVRVLVDPKEARVEIIAVSPAEFTVHLENLTTRSVPVRTRLIGAPLRGFEIAATTLEPEETLVSGPQSLVERVAAVEADIDLTGVHANFSQLLLLTARDDQGADIQSVTASPESASVSIELRQLEFSAPFIVVPSITGSPAPGFVVVGLQIEPPFVVITGPSDVFQGLNPTTGIATEPISIDGASADVVRTLTLRLPQGARVEQPSVTARVIISRVGTASPTPGGVSP